ncbi:ABC transporter ATP-binding protein [Cryobacterium glaciale]|uniref:ABC transporter ATP-binding protein n=1 Tax=Cryobacterium glaciale TaxID=1259145 RepID=A0A4R8V678_9MICO|nr:ABC transporter ATP-binding protein [Cryobacterium glaciale]
MPFLEIHDVRVNYGEVEALRGATLSVNEGETVAIVGANGAGKTTLINSISGLNRLSSGSIMFEGQPLGDLKPHRLPELGIVQVPEGRRLFARLSVDDNLQLGAYHKRARRDSVKGREEIYRLLPVLQDRKDQLAGTLSGGQQQMLAIGRALMAQPRLLLLDEPSLGLAPIVVTELFSIIARIASEGTAVLLVEQNVSRALALSNRAYALQQGTVIMEGTGQELLNDPGLPAAMLGIAAAAKE